MSAGSGNNHCEAVRELMLDAGPDELRGRADTALSSHLRRCEACRGVARRLLAGNALIDRMVRLVVDDFVGATDARPESAATVAGMEPGPRRATGLRWVGGLITATAAVVVALLFLGERSVRMDPAWSPPALEADRATEAGNTSATTAVFAGREQGITVIWLGQDAD